MYVCECIYVLVHCVSMFMCCKSQHLLLSLNCMYVLLVDVKGGRRVAEGREMVG